MTCCSKLADAPSRNGPSCAGDGVFSVIGRAWRAYWQKTAERAALEFLRLLDDKALSDIGIPRSEIDCLVAGENAPGRRCSARS